MANPIVYVLMGDPIPLARCRISRRTYRMYDTQKELKLVSQITLKNQHNQYGSRPLYKGPLKVESFFYFHIPKTKKDTHPLDYKTSKPDVDNLVKLILDMANGILFKDDSQVVEMICHKLYDINPRTEFIIEEIGKNGQEEKKRKTN